MKIVLSLKYPTPQEEGVWGFFETQETEVHDFMLKWSENICKSQQFSWDKTPFLAQIQIHLLTYSLFGTRIQESEETLVLRISEHEL